MRYKAVHTLGLSVIAGVASCMPFFAEAQDRAVPAAPQPPFKVTTEVGSSQSLLPTQTSESPNQPNLAPAISACVNGSFSPSTIMTMIKAETKAQGVDERLALAIAEQESAFGQNNNSDAGARGPMQLMPDTALQYGVKDICDSADNIRGGVAYLKDLQAEFDGNILLIVAAYNAGQQRVYKACGIPEIGQTVTYVARVANAYYDYKNVLQNSRINPSSPQTSQPQEKAMTQEGKVRPVNAANPTASTANEWIGGTVLYLTDDAHAP